MRQLRPWAKPYGQCIVASASASSAAIESIDTGHQTVWYEASSADIRCIHGKVEAGFKSIQLYSKAPGNSNEWEERAANLQVINE